MKNSEMDRSIAAICVVSMVFCLLVMCLQVSSNIYSANDEFESSDCVVSANAEISEGLSLKEKLEQDDSVWGRLARSIQDMVEAWQG